MELILICSNCRGPFTFKAESKIELDMAKELGSSWCCDACCDIAQTYFNSSVYKDFEESEL